MSSFVAPQLPKRVHALPEGPSWLYQEKYDGYRIQVVVHGGQATVYSRNGFDRTEQFRPILDPLRAITKADIVVDAELCVLDPSGISNFSLLCAGLGKGGPFSLLAFDLLAFDGEYLTGLPTSDRIDRLATLFPSSGTIAVAETTTDGAALLERVQSARGEGVVAKLASASILVPAD